MTDAQGNVVNVSQFEYMQLQQQAEAHAQAQQLQALIPGIEHYSPQEQMLIRQTLL
jgi:hypothetical protein